MNVLHLIETLGSGGAERLLFTNLKHLKSEEIKSEVVTVFDRDGYWRESIERLNVQVSSLNCSGYKDVLTGVARLMKHLGKTSPDLIHTHLFTANIIGRMAGRLSGVPVISSVHNPEYEPEAGAGASPAVRRKIATARIVDAITARTCCTRMIAVSEHVKESTVTRLGYPASKIDVVYNPADISEAVSEQVSRRDVLQSLGLQEDSILLLNVGRLSPQKGFIDAVRALPEVLSSVPNARLVSVGAQADPTYRSKVVAEMESLDLSHAVHLAGERRDIWSVLNQCDVFVFPSRFEGLGIALAEAMCAGRACVASDIAPLTEFVKDGVNGVLVPPGDSRRLAESILGLINDRERRESIGKAARLTALELFQPSGAAEKLKAIYYSTVKRR